MTRVVENGGRDYTQRTEVTRGVGKGGRDYTQKTEVTRGVRKASQKEFIKFFL